MNPTLIALIVMADVIVTALVVAVLLRRKLESIVPAGARLGDVIRMAKAMQDETTEYLRANWSGDVGSLPAPLGELVARCERRMAELGLPASHEGAKAIVTQVVVASRLANPRDVREAMSQVA